jgi:hypothetical protein
MMRIRDQIKADIEQMSPQELTVLRGIIESLRAPKVQKSSSQSDMDAYIKVRNALSGIHGSISADILKDREDRI